MNADTCEWFRSAFYAHSFVFILANINVSVVLTVVILNHPFQGAVLGILRGYMNYRVCAVICPV